MARMTLAELQARSHAPSPAADWPRFKVGMSTCGLAAGADAVFDVLDAGAAYLPKPFTASQLTLKIREILEAP